MVWFVFTANVLILRSEINLLPTNDEVTLGCLLEHVASVLFKENTPKDEKHFADVIEHLSCLADGLFVDLKFTGSVFVVNMSTLLIHT